MSLAQASLSELSNARNVLQDPLTGKSVMIPFTSKAFFPGTLQPSTTNSCEEQVLIKLSKQDFVESSRGEAIHIIDKRMQAMAGIPDKSIPSVPPATVPTPTSPVLPFFEIREELDASGTEIRAEAINVAKELEYLQRKEDSPEVVKQAQAVTAADTDMRNSAEQVESQKVVSDQEYDSILSRLDQLAKLEEESNVKKIVNQKSAKTLQGSGWTKGFLNKPTKKKAPKAPELPVEAAKAATPRKVAFGDNHVKEIPRLGERSVASLKPPSSGSAQPFATSVFTGVVQERSPTAKDSPKQTEPPKQMSRFAQQRMEQQEMMELEQKKKVSKFAQSRAQQK